MYTLDWSNGKPEWVPVTAEEIKHLRERRIKAEAEFRRTHGGKSADEITAENMRKAQ